MTGTLTSGTIGPLVGWLVGRMNGMVKTNANIEKFIENNNIYDIEKYNQKYF